MAKKTISRSSPSPARGGGKGGGKASRKGKAARVKGPKSRAKADQKAASAALPQWTPAEIEEAFRRFAKANPEPRGELQHVNPFTLLVAVVLSAQATDAGVNKATPALFALADTPQKMAALGEDRVRDLIKTIGLFRTKAKNVVALSEQLIARHGGEVPRDRDALEALPGVGRKTANVVLNIAFARTDHRGRHPHLPRRQPHRLGDRQDAARRRNETSGSGAGEISAPRPPLADPARPLHLRGAPAAVREMFDRGSVQVAGEGDVG